MIPVWFLRRWGRKWSDGFALSTANQWSLAIGTAQGKMEWWYTMDEVRDRLGDSFGR